MAPPLFPCCRAPPTVVAPVLLLLVMLQFPVVLPMSGQPTIRVDAGEMLPSELDFTLFTDKLGELDRVYAFQAKDNTLNLLHEGKVGRPGI